MRNIEGFDTICYCFGTFRNDYKFGANETGIFSICKDIFLNGYGKNFEKVEKKPQVCKKKFKFLKHVHTF